MKTTTYMTLTIAGTFAAIVATAVALAAVGPSVAVYSVETATGNSLVESIAESVSGTHASTEYFDGINVSAIAIGAYE